MGQRAGWTRAPLLVRLAQINFLHFAALSLLLVGLLGALWVIFSPPGLARGS